MLILNMFLFTVKYIRGIFIFMALILLCSGHILSDKELFNDTYMLINMCDCNILILI